MVCIHCGSNTQVTNSRLQKRRNQVWRRRQCVSCQALFTTEEGADYTAAWAVQGVEGGLEPFSRDKLFISMYESLKHRSAALADAGDLTDTVMQKLHKAQRDGVITHSSIIQTVEVALTRFDSVASTYYVAFHQR